MSKLKALVDEVLQSADPGRLAIGVYVLREARHVAVLMGDLSVTSLIPFEWFTPSPDTEPNFDDVEVIDSGQTIRFGEYEAAVDAILEKFPPAPTYIY